MRDGPFLGVSVGLETPSQGTGAQVQPPPPGLQSSGHFSLCPASLRLSPPASHPQRGPLPTSSSLAHRFRQVRLKHRKLREQVNSMVDISKVRGARKGPCKEREAGGGG